MLKKCLSILFMAAALLASRGAFGAGRCEAAADKDVVTVAYMPNINSLGGIINAMDKGYFAEENIKVNLVQFTSGASELAAMASGQINIAYIGLGGHVFAPQGQCYVIALDSTDTSDEIMARANSGIKRFKDLKGKTVAFAAGTTSDLLLSLALDFNGMKRSDVHAVNMDASGKVTAFMAGKIDAVATESPFTDQIRKELGASNIVTIASADDFSSKIAFTDSWVVSPSYLKEHPDVVVRFLKAWARGSEYRYNNMDATVARVAEYIHQDYDTAHLLVAKTHWLSAPDMRRIFTDGTAMTWYGNIAKMFVDAGLLDKKYDVPAQSFVKPEYLLKALDELGVK